MLLSPDDSILFFKLYLPLLLYVNSNFKILENIYSANDIRQSDPNNIIKIREQLYNHPELFDLFIHENPFKFSNNELSIIRSWKQFIKKKFIIFRYAKNYTIFIDDTSDDPKAYGVLAITSPLHEMVGSQLPKMVEAVLLPFKNCIIYDSILIPYSIHFGSNIRKVLNNVYQIAKSSYGIITSLPFEPKVKQSDADKLKYYLKSKHNRELYSNEIRTLINKDQGLLILFHQEMNKIDSKMYRKLLRNIGIDKGWFAMLEGIIIASSITKESLEQVVEQIIPEKKRKFVYIFQLKGN